MPDVVCLVETWLCSDILDTEISIPNYSIVRLDRNRHGGGVAYDIQKSWKRFKSAFMDVMEQCIPRSVLPARKNLPWLTKEIIQFFRKAHRSGNTEDHLKFRHARNRDVAELRFAKRRFLTNLHPHNQREFWKVVKSLTPKENSILTLSSENTIATTNLEKACLLNVTFTN